MAKLSNKSHMGTGFFGVVIHATPNQLINKLGNPQYFHNDGDGKSNFDWVCETSLGEIFTVYDWKEYRILDLNEEIQWHIGGYSKISTEDAKVELSKLLNS